MYRMYLDEVGTDDLTSLESDNHRYMSLTGVVIHLEHVDAYLNPTIRNIKNSVFDVDPDEVVHLHRSDIVRRKRVFGQLNENHKRTLFNEMIFDLMSVAQYRVITAVIDKLEMTNQLHWENRHPYHYLLEILVEKYVQLLERLGDTGDIMPEARRGKKDKALQDEYLRFWSNGTRFRTSDLVQQRLKAKSLKFRTKSDNVAGLQLCDLLAHASHFHVRERQGHDVELGPFSTRVREILVHSKYDRSPYNGRIIGYGYKYCP